MGRKTPFHLPGKNCLLLSDISDELKNGLILFWESAGNILSNSKVSLKVPDREKIRIEDHFFSMLFLYAYVRAGINPEKRKYYVAVNQCLRGMVTGCDNLLDQEYKVTLETSLPEQATIFRSVLDIMVSDRVLTDILFTGYDQNLFTLDQVRRSGQHSLDALIESGVQEAGEEQGVETVLPAQTVLDDIHTIKTGMLFQAPWALPDLFENNIDPLICETVKKGLFQIGMGCQIIDDMVDMGMDLKMKRHNYVLSLIQEENASIRQKIKTAVTRHTARGLKVKDLVREFPDLFGLAAHKAESFLELGFRGLFPPEHEHMIPFCISFLIKRIQAEDFFDALKKN